MTPKPWLQRVLAGGGALLLILLLTPDDGEQAEPARAVASELPPAAEPSSRPPSQAVPRVELERLAQRDDKVVVDTAAGNAFDPASWYVPPPPPPPQPRREPAPPPPPTAPPMPFSYLGRYEEDGAMIILLLKGERMYTVSEGEVIERTYRVERLSGGRLELTYLPLNIKQTLSTGETS